MPTLPDDTPFDASHESPQSSPRGPEARNGVQGLRLALPGAALLVTLGLFGYAVSTGSRSDKAPVQSASSASGAAKPGDFSPQAGWIKNFTAQLSVFGYESLPPQFSGNGYRFASLPPTDLPKFVEAAITNTGPAEIRLALSTPVGGQPGKAQAIASEETAIESLSVEFPANSAKIPSRDAKIIRRAAETIKALPGGTAVELIGYFAGTSVSPKGAALARQRANSVYRALIRAGVNPTMLRPKGDGSATIEARSGAELEGRSSTRTETARHPDRRVEFRVVEPSQQ